MEEQKVTKEDYDFLWRIVSLQHALVSSSADPVVLRTIKEGADFEMTVYGGMYYDVCRNEKLAVSTVRKRIELEESDIRQRFKFHKKALEYFLEMDRAIISGDRGLFSDNCEVLCKDSLEYFALVKDHKERLRESSFLVYPFCHPGHYFHVLNGPFVKTCDFNPYESYLQGTSGVQDITEKIPDFKIRQDKLPYVHLPLNEQEGAGLSDINFKNNLATNKLLLERAGLDLRGN